MTNAVLTWVDAHWLFAVGILAAFVVGHWGGYFHCRSHDIEREIAFSRTRLAEIKAEAAECKSGKT